MEKRKPLWRRAVPLVLSLAVTVAAFAFIMPRLGDYQQAFAQLGEISWPWLVAIAAASAFSLLTYPLTAQAAIPGLKYKPAFLSRQSGFFVSNVIPGGGAVAVGTQYSVLARYGVPSTRAAVAVSADTIWTYLLTLGMPTLALIALHLEGRSAGGYTALSIGGAVVVAISVTGLVLALRSPQKLANIIGKFDPMVSWAFSKAHREPVDLKRVVSDFHGHSAELLKRRWLPMLGTNFLAQMTPALVLWAALAGLGQWDNPVTSVEIVAAFSIAFLLTAVPITPGGVGTVDAALVALLVAFGADNDAALAADLIWRLCWFLPQLAVGGGALAIHYLGRKTRGSSAVHAQVPADT